MKDRGINVVIFGPHAGGIEPGTSELVTAIAGQELSLYLFEGKKPKGNGVLHITSTNFDEPEALAILVAYEKAIAFHGEGSEAQTVYVGGRDKELRPYIEERLEEAGFALANHDNLRLQGTSSENICNRCASGAGMQLELSHGLRQRFFHSLSASGRCHPTEKFNQFVQAIRAGLERANAF